MNEWDKRVKISSMDSRRTWTNVLERKEKKQDKRKQQKFFSFLQKDNCMSDHAVMIQGKVFLGVPSVVETQNLNRLCELLSLCTLTAATESDKEHEEHTSSILFFLYQGFTISLPSFSSIVPSLLVKIIIREGHEHMWPKEREREDQHLNSNHDWCNIEQQRTEDVSLQRILPSREGWSSLIMMEREGHEVQKRTSFKTSSFDNDRQTTDQLQLHCRTSVAGQETIMKRGIAE